jgi:DNA polymerase III epsilon subunit family exonuclease
VDISIACRVQILEHLDSSSTQCCKEDNMTQDISTLDFVAFDTETTGLSPSSEHLVEVAAVRFSLLEGAKEYFQSLVNPGRPIPPQATRVHGITDAMVASAPPVEKVLPAMLKFFTGAVPVAHNAPFDIGFLSHHALRHGIETPNMLVLDSCMFSRRVCKELPSHRLQALVEAFSIQEGTFHRALADAKSCMEIFRILVDRSCGPRASWEELLNHHGRARSFGESSRPLDSEKMRQRLEPLFAALEARKPVWIFYEGNLGAREVTPLLLYAKGAQQYMEATCHLDGIRKCFRLDKVKRAFASPTSPVSQEGI